jgi:Helicase conserved C-terminal domain
VAHDEVISDRLTALRAMTPSEVAHTLSLLPHAAGLLVGVGPLHQVLSPSGRGLSLVESKTPKGRAPDLKRIALAVGHTLSIRLTLEMLEPAALQLATVLAGLGGSLNAADFARELAPLEAARRDELVDSLVVRLLAQRRGTHVALRTGVAEFLRPPGRPLDRLVLDQAVTSDAIAQSLRRLGVHAVPPRKGQRIEALREIVGSIDSLNDIASRMPPSTHFMFDSLLAAGPRGALAAQLGVPAWQLRSYSRFPAEHPLTCLRELNDLGLIWIDENAQRVGLWLEVHIAIRGRMFESWPLPEPVKLRPIDGTTAQLPPVLTALQNLLRVAAMEPLPGLKTRGLGVRTVKDLAKRLGVAAPRLALLFDLAQGLGLIEEVAKWAKAGRSGSWQYVYRTHAATALEWDRLDPIGQWASLVAAWAEGRGSAHDVSPSPSLRRQAVADLLALNPGDGVADSFASWLCQHHVGAQLDAATQLLDELLALDLVPAVGPTGLTPLARALITDPLAASALLPEMVESFTVQADLTIVAPPALAPQLRAQLDRICVIESDSSVVVFRLDPLRVAAELADGETADSLISFLVESSSVPVAPSVMQMIRDTERQRGGLTIAAAATVVTAHDVLGLAEAVKVKAARLTLVAPTVAVSDLPLGKVLAALRAKGLAPAGTAAGTSIGGLNSDDEVVPNPWRGLPRPSGVMLIHPSRKHIEEVVADATS